MAGRGGDVQAGGPRPGGAGPGGGGAGGAAGGVMGESGEEARGAYLRYRGVEAHVSRGRAVIISIEPDETLNAVRRLDEGALDPPSGRLVIGAEIGSYISASELD